MAPKLSTGHCSGLFCFAWCSESALGDFPLDDSITAWYHFNMNAKQRRTLESVFADPVRADIPWRDVEALFVALGAIVRQGAGSRVCAALNDVRAVFHRPHPEKETDKGAVKSVRRFLESAGIRP